MGIKAKLGMSIATGVLAFGLIGGGTYAYFSDTEVNNSSFEAGTLQIGLGEDNKNEALFTIDKLQPGDSIKRTLSINNTGNLNVGELLLTSTYSVKDRGLGNEGKDIGEHFVLELLGQDDNIIYSSTLAKLQNDTAGGQDILNYIGGGNGLNDVDKSKDVKVNIKFVDDGDQNVFQKDSLNLTLSFEARTSGGTKK